MFERYTVKARRAIFFARFEAGAYGSGEIAPEHLLLGLFREPNPLWRQLGSIGNLEVFRMEVGPEVPLEERFPTNKEMPFSTMVKQALSFATEEADRLNQPQIGTKHLLIGLLRIGDCRALDILKSGGVDPEKAVAVARTMEGSDGEC